MTKNLNLQEVFLNQVRKDKTFVTMFLMNGVKINGVVKGFDSFVVILESAGTQQVVYKHAISTIIPSKNVNILTASEQEETE